MKEQRHTQPNGSKHSCATTSPSAWQHAQITQESQGQWCSVPNKILRCFSIPQHLQQLNRSNQDDPSNSRPSIRILRRAPESLATRTIHDQYKLPDDGHPLLKRADNRSSCTNAEAHGSTGPRGSAMPSTPKSIRTAYTQQQPRTKACALVITTAVAALTARKAFEKG